MARQSVDEVFWCVADFCRGEGPGNTIRSCDCALWRAFWAGQNDRTESSGSRRSSRVRFTKALHARTPLTLVGVLAEWWHERRCRVCR